MAKKEKTGGHIGSSHIGIMLIIEIAKIEIELTGSRIGMMPILEMAKLELTCGHIAQPSIHELLVSS